MRIEEKEVTRIMHGIRKMAINTPIGPERDLLGDALLLIQIGVSNGCALKGRKRNTSAPEPAETEADPNPLIHRLLESANILGATAVLLRA